MRGEVNHGYDRFSMMQHAVSNNLSAWLGNLYLEIRHLPREALDQRGEIRNEFHVELDFVNKLLQLGTERRVSKRSAASKRSQVMPSEAKPGSDEECLLGDKDEGGAFGPRAKVANEGRAHRSWWRRRRTIFDRPGVRARRSAMARARDATRAKAESDADDRDANDRSPTLHSNRSNRSNRAKKTTFSDDETGEQRAAALALDDHHAGQLSESSGDDLWLGDAEKAHVAGDETRNDLGDDGLLIFQTSLC